MLRLSRRLAQDNLPALVPNDKRIACGVGNRLPNKIDSSRRADFRRSVALVGRRRGKDWLWQGGNFSNGERIGRVGTVVHAACICSPDSPIINARLQFGKLYRAARIFYRHKRVGITVCVSRKRELALLYRLFARPADGLRLGHGRDSVNRRAVKRIFQLNLSQLRDSKRAFRFWAYAARRPSGLFGNRLDGPSVIAVRVSRQVKRERSVAQHFGTNEFSRRISFVQIELVQVRVLDSVPAKARQPFARNRKNLLAARRCQDRSRQLSGHPKGARLSRILVGR